MKTLTVLTCCAALALTGCAAYQPMPATGFTQAEMHTPIIDRQGVDENQLNRDLFDCQRYAAQAAPVGGSAAAGAVAGALLGAILMGAAGGQGLRNEAAAVGAISGGLSAGADAAMTRRSIVSRCMIGRGYRVLN